MRLIAIALASLYAGIVVAVSSPGLPACAGDCVTGFGQCNQVDVNCICSNQSLLAKLSCCVSKNCNAHDQDETIQFANALCSANGVSSLPTKATCISTASSTSASGSSTASSSGSASSATTTSALSRGSGSGASSSSAAPAQKTGGGVSNMLGGNGLGLVVAGVVAAL